MYGLSIFPLLHRSTESYVLVIITVKIYEHVNINDLGI